MRTDAIEGGVGINQRLSPPQSIMVKAFLSASEWVQPFEELGGDSDLA